MYYELLLAWQALLRAFRKRFLDLEFRCHLAD